MSGHAESLAALDSRYARAREAVAARRDGAFGEWTGHVGRLEEPLRSRVDQRLSATILQSYATCPLQFWLNRVLGVRDLDDPGEDDTIDAATKGSLVHDVLERFFRESLPTGSEPGRDPDQPWTPTELARARHLLDQACDELRSPGSPAARCCGRPRRPGCTASSPGSSPSTAPCAPPADHDRSPWRTRSAATATAADPAAGPLG